MLKTRGLGKTKGALKKGGGGLHTRPHTRPISSNRCVDIRVLESKKIVTNPEGDMANAQKFCCWCMFLMKKKGDALTRVGWVGLFSLWMWGESHKCDSSFI